MLQARGPATAKARSRSVERRVAGTVKSAEEAERRRRRDSMFSTGQMTSCRYLGAVSCTQFKNQNTEFVLGALRDPQPMKVGEQRRCVVMKLCSDCETCGSIHDRLKSIQFTAWQSGVGDITVIRFGHNQTGDECQHGLSWQRAANAADLPQNAEARADESRDL